VTLLSAWAVFVLTSPPASAAPASDAPVSVPENAAPAAPLPRCTAFAALTRTATVERDMAWREARLVARTTETTDVAVQAWTPRGPVADETALVETCRDGARRFCEAQGTAPGDCRFAPHGEAAAPSWDSALPVAPPPPTPPSKTSKPKRQRPQKRRSVTTP